MGGFLVRDGGLLCAVDLHQGEVGRVGVVLKDVEAGDAGLLHAGGRIGDGGGFEGVDVGGIDVDVDVDDEHGLFPHLTGPLVGHNGSSVSIGNYTQETPLHVRMISLLQEEIRAHLDLTQGESSGIISLTK